MGVTFHLSDQCDRQVPKWYTEVKALVTDILEDPQEETLEAQKKRGQVKNQANPVAPVKGKGDSTH